MRRFFITLLALVPVFPGAVIAQEPGPDEPDAVATFDDEVVYDDRQSAVVVDQPEPKPVLERFLIERVRFECVPKRGQRDEDARDRVAHRAARRVRNASRSSRSPARPPARSRSARR